MPLVDVVRAFAAQRLERGDRSAPARVLAAGWGLVASPRLARPLVLPEGLQVIGVGSAVLGGAGKTPLAIALARALAGCGARVVLVGHAYRATPGRPRQVAPDDRLVEVGDDALSAARALADLAVPVIVAPRRQHALDHAAVLGGRIALVDGLLQAAPRRLAASILVLDGGAPWGAGACPPAGDLRAPRAALLAASDHQVVITSAPVPPLGLPSGTIVVPAHLAGATSPEGVIPLETLRRLRAGLLLTVARPERVVVALGAAGIDPDPVLLLGDHATPSARLLARAERAAVDVWLTTARCAVKLPPRLGRAPVLALDRRLDLTDLLGVLGFPDRRPDHEA